MESSSRQPQDHSYVSWFVRLPCLIVSGAVFGYLVYWMRQVPWTSEKGDASFILLILIIATHNFFLGAVVFKGRKPLWLIWLTDSNGL